MRNNHIINHQEFLSGGELEKCQIKLQHTFVIWNQQVSEQNDKKKSVHAYFSTKFHKTNYFSYRNYHVREI